MEDLVDAGGRFALPAGTGEQIAAGRVAGGPAADVAIVAGIHIGELDGVVALLFHLGNGENQGSARRSAWIMPVGRVAVGGDDGSVLGVKTWRRQDVIEWSFVLAGLSIDIQLIHRLIGRDHRKAIDIGFADDVLDGPGVGLHRISRFRRGFRGVLWPGHPADRSRSPASGTVHRIKIGRVNLRNVVLMSTPWPLA